MALLRQRHTAIFLALLILLAASLAHAADVLPFVTGVEAAVNGAAGPGSVYAEGQSIRLLLGDEEDHSNHSGDAHFSFNRQFSPLDQGTSTAPSGAEKFADNIVVGVAVDLWKGGSLGIDLDSLTDKNETLQADGVKISVGQQPFQFSYHYERSVITSPFVIVNPQTAKSQTALGAFIYQHTFALDGSFDLGPSDDLGLDVSYSFFRPDVATFGTLLNTVLQAISTFNDTLQSFETWGVSPNWKHEWSEKWETNWTLHFAHLIIPGDTLFETTEELGWKATPAVRLQLGLDYTWQDHTPQNLVTLEVRVTWDR